MMQSIIWIDALYMTSCEYPHEKMTFMELDITFHVLVSQLFGHCDVIINWLWCHQQ